MGFSSVLLLMFKFFGNATLVSALFRFIGSIYKAFM
jgi:hypothetical protein